MTQKGKCDTCRQRKVKCDESKPICEVCSNSHRPCSYKQEKASSQIGLTLRQVRHAGQDQGAFFVLGPQSIAASLGKPSPSLSNDVTRLASRWVRMLTRMPTSSTTYIMPSRLGLDPALDKAAVYMCDSHQAHMDQREIDVLRAHTSGNKAMVAVRNSLNAQGANFSDFAMLAISLLLSAQYLVGVQIKAHQLHAIALTRMLVKRWRCGQWGTLEQLLARHVSIEESGASIYAGTISDLDDSRRLEPRSLSQDNHSTRTAEVSNIVTDMHIQLPRLVHYVRQILAGRNDPKHIGRTLRLAKVMNEAFPKDGIEHWIAESSETAECVTNPLGCRIDYSDDEVFGLTTRYYMYRSAICGLVQRISHHADPTLFAHYFDRNAIEFEDLEVAGKLVMSTEYAFQPTKHPPYFPIRLYTPLLVSYTAWTRLKDRYGGQDESINTYVATMKDFVYETSTRVMALWRIKPAAPQRYEQMSNVYCGGPAIPELSGKRPKDVLPDDESHD